jgi:hypothetical protein
MIRTYREQGVMSDRYKLNNYVEAACDWCGCGCPDTRIHGMGSYGQGGDYARVRAESTPGWHSGVIDSVLRLWCPTCAAASESAAK